MVNDELDDVSRRAPFGVQEEIRLPVERFTFGQELAESRLGFGRLEQGAVGLAADPGPEGLG